MPQPAFLVDGTLNQTRCMAEHRSNAGFPNISGAVSEGSPQKDQAAQVHAVALGAHGAVVALVHPAKAAEIILGSDNAKPLEAFKKFGVYAEIFLRKCVQVSHACI